MSTMDRCFSLAELADHWRCSKRHITRMVQSGRLQAVNIGTDKKQKLVFRPQDVENFNQRQDDLRYQW